jgi:hypothetical protein
MEWAACGDPVGLCGEENVMDARTGAEAITTRIGAMALPLGIILFVVSTAIFHPNREAPMDKPAIFKDGETRKLLAGRGGNGNVLGGTGEIPPDVTRPRWEPESLKATD